MLAVLDSTVLIDFLRGRPAVERVAALRTAIATVMAFLYNICSALVGGVQLTLTDD